eukprot:5622991-Alexandrium_andersonii.AAC.1
MSASLVGSEMCIRDSPSPLPADGGHWKGARRSHSQPHPQRCHRGRHGLPGPWLGGGPYSRPCH